MLKMKNNSLNIILILLLKTYYLTPSKGYEENCFQLIEKKLPIPAYELCIKASHCFNLLDARGLISVTERQSYILRIRNLVQKCCYLILENNE